MKRSERLAQLAASLEGHVRLSKDYQEMAARLLQEEETAFGLKWDPEEEPLPEKLIFRPGTAVLNAAAQLGNKRLLIAYHHREGERVLAETVRRYNAWPALREIVQEWASYIETSKRYSLKGDLPTRSVPALLAILDGTGEEAPRG